MILFATVWNAVFLLLFIIAWHKAVEEMRKPSIAKVVARVWIDMMILALVCGPVWVYALTGGV